MYIGGRLMHASKDYFEEFLPDDAREAVAADIEKVSTGRPTRGFENAVVTHDGQQLLFDTRPVLPGVMHTTLKRAVSNKCPQPEFDIA